MNELRERLGGLGLSQYYEVFVSEGFDTWETILDITESDLNSLGVKLGHRRKLQRAIAEARGVSHDRALPHTLGQPAAGVAESYKSEDSGGEGKHSKKSDPVPPGPPGTTKRKYRRHPKADENAPERPPSAYVIFSNQIREELKGQDLSFTEIAKYVGERWQVLSPDARETCERQANTAKEKYYAELTEYKKTPQFADYQEYLKEFKAKHAPTQSDGKRSKTETEAGASTRSSSHENYEKTHRRGISGSVHDSSTSTRRRSGSSPPQPGPSRSLYPVHSKSTSPATYSAFNSPHMADHYSPMSSSPRSASAFRELQIEQLSQAGGGGSGSVGGSSSATDSRERILDPHVHPPPFLSRQSTSSTHSSTGFTPTIQAVRDLPQRRSRRESAQLPSLTHEDTTISADSATSSSPYPAILLPALDASKSKRVLPHPVPTLSATPSPLDIRGGPLPPLSGSTEYRHGSSSLAALLRAGEMARDADMRDDKEPPD